jgi:putative membrane protein
LSESDNNVRVHDAENVDATRRTLLANERTYLAWIRSGLTALAVAVGAGRLVPDVTGGTRWPYEVVGAAFGVLGLAFVALGYLRRREIDRALLRGDFAPLDDRVALGLTVAGAALGVATVLIVIFGN